MPSEMLLGANCLIWKSLSFVVDIQREILHGLERERFCTETLLLGQQIQS